jgi:hypothetical protein
MAITPLPAAPETTDTPQQFNSKAFAFVQALDGFVTEANAQATTINSNATNSTTSANTATTKASEASASANAAAVTADVTLWVSGTTYSIGDNVFSPITLETYRSKSAFTSTTDPSADDTNWQQITAVSPDEIVTPVNVDPTDEETDIGETPTLEGSTYYSLYGKTQKSSQWQIDETSDFSSSPLTYDSGEVVAVGVTHAVPPGNLSVSTTYYWRVRYRDIDDAYSEYSTPTEFDTKASFNDFIATPTATPAAFGDSLEGGFYAGLIWNEATQSATSTAIGTGSKTFTTTQDMAVTPLFYSGQAVEVRSRANPSTARMIGTVTGALGTSLTVNVTSVDGSGTLTDWSIMAKFRVIVSPKSSGENYSQFKNATTAAPTATRTLTEGLKATLAMVADGNATVYPAAHFCNNLSTGGYSDWYMPARDELELCFRNLKPMTNNNYVVANRPVSAYNYATLGSLADTANTHGTNNNSNPQGVAYTTTVPGQTSVLAFQTGGAEAFTASQHWASTEFSSANSFTVDFRVGEAGRQDNIGYTSTYYTRAVRRSII